MDVSYDVFIGDFLQKITEYNFLRFDEELRDKIVDGYMKHAIQQFSVVCKNVITGVDDTERIVTFNGNTDTDRDEIIDIITEGMLVQWMKPYMYKQENLENMLNSTDFSSYSPAELLKRVNGVYDMCKKDFTNRIRSYSYDHGDLTDLHL